MKSRTHLPFILASTSPRRIYLLSQVNINAEVQRPDADERPKKDETSPALVRRLSQAKAQSVIAIATQRYEESIILAADTIVASPNGQKPLGKPETPQEAIRMLKLLSGKTHSVFTGYSIAHASRKRPPKVFTRVIKSKVTMRRLSQQEIMLYVASGEPMDKAGSYGAQGLGMTLIEKIDGSHTNVIGLPMAQIFMDLEKQFKIKLFSWMNKK